MALITCIEFTCPKCSLCREIMIEYNRTKSSADSGNQTEQLRCFGLGETHPKIAKINIKIFNIFNLTEYPTGCETYYGPYSVACLTSIWSSVKCFREGTGSPDKLSSSVISSYTGLGLRFEILSSFHCSENSLVVHTNTRHIDVTVTCCYLYIVMAVMTSDTTW